jgi:hypothetical protein
MEMNPTQIDIFFQDSFIDFVILILIDIIYVPYLACLYNINFRIKNFQILSLL